MPRKAANPEDLRTRLAELSGWQTATRDDAAVAKELHETRAMDRVYPLNTASFFDELFHYIQEIGAWPVLEESEPDTRVGPSYEFIKFVLLTIMRCVGGVQSMLAMHDLVLTDDALMALLGFNAAQVSQGSNDRGLDRRTRPVEIRGALSYETIANNIVEVGPEKLESMFNGAIRCLVILDTDPSDDPFTGFDHYDDRSLIENTCNREAKESWFLEHHPKRSEAGMRVHAYFVFTCMALVEGFRLHLQTVEEAESRGEETGIARYRRQLEVRNRDKVIVFCFDRFGIFRNHEAFLLVGIAVRERALMGESAQTVLARYRSRPPDTSWLRRGAFR